MFIKKSTARSTKWRKSVFEAAEKYWNQFDKKPWFQLLIDGTSVRVLAFTLEEQIKGDWIEMWRIHKKGTSRFLLCFWGKIHHWNPNACYMKAWCKMSLARVYMDYFTCKSVILFMLFITSSRTLIPCRLDKCHCRYSFWWTRPANRLFTLTALLCAQKYFSKANKPYVKPRTLNRTGVFISMLKNGSADDWKT